LLDDSLKNRTLKLPVCDHTAPIEIHHCDAIASGSTGQTRLDDLTELAVLVGVRGAEVDEPALIDRDQPNVRGSTVDLGAERSEEFPQHLVVGILAFVLAAVVVGTQPDSTGQADIGPVGTAR